MNEINSLDKYSELIKYAENIFTLDETAQMAVVVMTEEGNMIGFVDMADNVFSTFNRIAAENQFQQLLVKQGETRLCCGLCLWKNGETDIPSANLRERLKELDTANLEMEFILRGGTGYHSRKLSEMHFGQTSM